MIRPDRPLALNFPRLRGGTRQLVQVALGSFLCFFFLGFTLPDLNGTLAGVLVLQPGGLRSGLVWQLVTYPFLGTGIISVLLSVVSLWFLGSALENDRGRRWLMEYFFVSTIAGGLLACLLALATMGHVPGIVLNSGVRGLGPSMVALIVAFATFYAEQEISIYFVFNVKAKHLATIIVAVYFALAVLGGDRFGPLTALCVAGCGYGYLRLVPRRGLFFIASEKVYGWRNAFYRAKRQRAAKKFTVYMKKNGNESNFHSSGPYVDTQGNPRDPNDRRWMN